MALVRHVVGALLVEAEVGWVLKQIFELGRVHIDVPDNASPSNTYVSVRVRVRVLASARACST